MAPFKVQVSQTTLVRVADRVREEHLCGYRGRHGCDCKFGYLEGKGEAHGCAEMNVISDVLRAMTPFEFTRIVKRLNYAEPVLPDNGDK
jgi:hypothetical protein